MIFQQKIITIPSDLLLLVAWVQQGGLGSWVLDNREVARLGRPTHVLHWTHTLIYNKQAAGELFIALKKHWVPPQKSKESNQGVSKDFWRGNCPSWLYVVITVRDIWRPIVVANI